MALLYALLLLLLSFWHRKINAEMKSFFIFVICSKNRADDLYFQRGKSKQMNYTKRSYCSFSLSLFDTASYFVLLIKMHLFGEINPILWLFESLPPNRVCRYIENEN